MFKRTFECLECYNGATVYTASKESIGFCSFCGETIVVEPAEFDEDDEEIPRDAWSQGDDE